MIWMMFGRQTNFIIIFFFFFSKQQTLLLFNYKLIYNMFINYCSTHLYFMDKYLFFFFYLSTQGGRRFELMTFVLLDVVPVKWATSWRLEKYLLMCIAWRLYNGVDCPIFSSTDYILRIYVYIYIYIWFSCIGVTENS